MSASRVDFVSFAFAYLHVDAGLVRDFQKALLRFVRRRLVLQAADGVVRNYVQQRMPAAQASGQMVVDNDGMHGPFEAAGIIRLKAGLHPIVVDYFERDGNELLRLSWEGPDLPKQEIPAAAFFTES